MSELIDRLEVVKRMVAEQAKDRGLWFTAETAAEAYVQSKLRELHAAAEGVSQDECAKATVTSLTQFINDTLSRAPKSTGLALFKTKTGWAAHIGEVGDYLHGDYSTGATPEEALSAAYQAKRDSQ